MPSAPYCSTGDVYLLSLYAHDIAKTDFDAETKIKPAVVTTWISQVASQIDAAYSAAGYEIPLTAISGEDWPAWQTTFLKYFNAIGVASILGGNSTTPPPVLFIGGKRATNRSFYEAEWMRLIDDFQVMRDGGRPQYVLIRASTRVGTLADRMLTDPSPPLSNFLEGYVDPGDFDYLRDFTKRYEHFMDYMTDGNPPTWDNRDSLHFMALTHTRLGLTFDAD